MTSSSMEPLQIPVFKSLWTVSMFSHLGSFLQITAAAWLMWEITRSATWVGLMTASRTLPTLILALPAGVAADRFDRTAVVTVAQVAMAASAGAMAILTFAGAINPPLLLILGLALGAAHAINQPSWHSLIPDMVPLAMVPSAVTLNSVGFNVARSVGPALGGLLVATVGPAAGFGLNAASFVGVITVLMILGDRINRPDRDTTSATEALRTGVMYARHSRPLRTLILVGALFAMGSAVLQAMLPVKSDELGGGAATYGILLGLIGVGALLGGLARHVAVDRMGKHSVAISISLFGLAGLATGLSPTPLIASMPLVLAGASWVWTLATINATIQLTAPDWVRGRVLSLWLFSFGGISALGAIAAGIVAEFLGAGGAMAILSAATLAFGLVARTLGIPSQADARSPVFTNARVREHPVAEGGPILILNTWRIDEEDVEEFLSLMNDIRLARLQTGAVRWDLYRNLDDPHMFFESYRLKFWDAHLRQHARIDDAATGLIKRAKALDKTSLGLKSYHLIAINTADARSRPPTWHRIPLQHTKGYDEHGSGH